MAKPVISSPHSALFKRIAWLLLLLLGWQQAMAITMQQTALAHCYLEAAQQHHQHHDHSMHGMHHPMSIEEDRADHQHHLSCEHCIACCQTLFSENHSIDIIFISHQKLDAGSFGFMPLSPLSSLYRPPIFG